MKTKIAQFIDTDSVGGAEVMLLELSAELEKQGYSPTILHFGNSELCRRAEKLGIKTLLVPGKVYYKKTATLPFFALQFARFLKKHNFELLHAHLFGPVIASAPAARLAGIKAIGTLHDKYIVQEKYSRAYLLKIAELCKMRLVSVSRDMHDFYRSLKQSISTVVVHNGVDTNYYCPIADKISGMPPHIIAVGRLVKLKRFDLLIDSFSQLSKSVAAKLTIVGDGPEMENLLQLVKKNDLTHLVNLVGEQQDVKSYLAQGDLFCLLSETEGLSRSIIEALSCGIPVIATNVGGNSELIREGENGLLISEITAEKVASKITALLNNKELLSSFSNEARKQAVEQFSIDSMIKKYLALYK